MDVTAVFDRLATAGIAVNLDSGRIRAEPATALTDEIRTLIREYRIEILAALTLPIEVEQRLDQLLAIGAIDQEDADLVRRRWHAYPDEWMFLLDCCERAVSGDGTPA